MFGGDANGRFRAFDERSGKILWETNLGAPVSGYPITFAVDGKQCVSVATGPSGVANDSTVTPEIAEHDRTGFRVRLAISARQRPNSHPKPTDRSSRTRNPSHAASG